MVEVTPLRGVPHLERSTVNSMRIPTAIFAFLMLCHSAMGFFVSLTPEERIAQSTLIAVIEVNKVDAEEGRSRATVIQSILGPKVGESIEMWDDWQFDANGSEGRIAGRDPNFEVGKRYLIYLVKNQRGRLVAVQSSLDCIEVTGNMIEKEAGDGFEPLEHRLARIKTILSQIKKAEPGGTGQPAASPASKSEGE